MRRRQSYIFGRYRASEHVANLHCVLRGETGIWYGAAQGHRLEQVCKRGQVPAHAHRCDFTISLSLSLSLSFSLSLSLYIYISLSISLSLYVCVCAHEYIQICIDTCMYIHLYTYMCMWSILHMHTHTYTRICAYTYACFMCCVHLRTLSCICVSDKPIWIMWDLYHVESRYNKLTGRDNGMEFWGSVRAHMICRALFLCSAFLKWLRCVCLWDYL